MYMSMDHGCAICAGFHRDGSKVHTYISYCLTQLKKVRSLVFSFHDHMKRNQLTPQVVFQFQLPQPQIYMCILEQFVEQAPYK